jgi:Glycosyl hydrolase family 30 beta sandwich domain
MRRQSRLASMRAILLAALLCGIAHGGDTVAFRLDAKTTFQTFEGWSCVPNPAGYERAFVAWLRDPRPETYDRVPMRRDLPSKLIARMHDALVDELGITRVRIEVGPQVEQVNDNADPRVTDAARYRFAWQDDQIERHVLPMRKRIEARGERMTIYVSYDLRSKLTGAFLLEPEEYAEMAVAFLAHAKERHGIEPDYWSVLNEPGNDRPGDPRLCAELTAATGRRIAEAGFRTRMSGPECVTVAQADRYMKGMEGVPGALDRFAQITYHLYHGGAEDVAARNAVRDWARRLKITAAQTEWMEAKDLDVARHIHLCLTEADAVAWDRFGADLFFALPYRELTDRASDGKEPQLSSTAWHIRQFSRFIRPGAVRVALAGGSESVKGVAFLAKGLPVVVLLNTSGETHAAELDGLKQGRYGRCFTSASQGAYGKEMPDVAVPESGKVLIELPPRSVSTLAAAKLP